MFYLSLPWKIDKQFSCDVLDKLWYQGNAVLVKKFGNILFPFFKIEF